MNSIAWSLYYKYATSISTYHAGADFDSTSECAATCENSQSRISNMRWNVEDSVIRIDPEPEPQPQPEPVPEPATW